MRNTIRILWPPALLILGLLTIPPIEARISEELVLGAKKSVVNVKKSVSHALGRDSARRTHATGFIVDARRGIVATNRHVAGESPARFLITFDNGETAEARLLHYDIYHDFAFLRLDMSDIDFPLHEVTLGSSFDLEEQDEVVMIGNNDVEEYSVKFGRVTNLILDKGDRHSATFQTSFDRAGGSSGSPVFDDRGRVVGIHFAGSSTTSFEMRIEYVSDALKQLRESGRVRRGDIGLELGLMRLSDARDHFRLPREIGDRIAALRPGIKRLIYVARLAPLGPTETTLLPGDLLVEVDGTLVGDDLYRVDRIVDRKVHDQVTLTLYRNGERMEHRVTVPDAEKTKTRRFALYAGGVLHDLTPDVRLRYHVRTDGVFLSQADPGSPLGELGQGRDKQPLRRTVVIEQVNGIPTPTLDAFVRAVRPLETEDDVYVIMQDMGSSQRTSDVEWFTLDLKYEPLRLFELDRDTLDWDEADERP